MRYNVLTGEYKAIYDQARSYGSYIGGGSDFLEECLMDLEDILLTAQEQNTPLNKIIGRSEEEFCRSYFSAYSIKERLHTLIRLERTTLILSLLYAISSMVEAALNGQAITEAKIGLGWTVCVVFDVTFLIFYRILFQNWMQHTYFRIRHHNRLINLAILGIVLVCLSLSFIYCHWMGALPALPVAIISEVYIGGYYIPNVIRNYRRTGHFRKQTVSLEIRQQQRHQSRRTRDIAFVHEMEMIWKKENARRAKHGKPPMTKTEHMHQFQTQNHRLPIMLFSMLLLFFAMLAFEGIVLGFSPFLWIVNGGYIGASIAIFFAWRSRIRIEKACVKQNINLLDYQG